MWLPRDEVGVQPYCMPFLPLPVEFVHQMYRWLRVSYGTWDEPFDREALVSLRVLGVGQSLVCPAIVEVNQ